MLEWEGIPEPPSLNEELWIVDGFSGRDSWVFGFGFSFNVTPAGWTRLHQMASQPGVWTVLIGVDTLVK